MSELKTPPSLIHISAGEIELKHVKGTVWEIRHALVLFGDGIKSADFVNDWFASDTDYDLDENGHGESSVYFNHGLDEIIGKARIGVGKAKLTKDDKAVWLQHQLDTAQEYDEMVVELIKRRKSMGKNFGLSSGVPPHLVEREKQPDGSYKITKWSLGLDASITLIPNDWRHTLLDEGKLERSNVKSLFELSFQSTHNKRTTITFDDNGKPVITYETQPKEINSETETENETEAQLSEDDESTGANEADVEVIADDVIDETKKTVEVITMTEQTMPESQANEAPPEPAPAPQDNGMKARLDGIEQQVSGVMDALTKFMEQSPRITSSGFITMDGGTADRNIKNAPDMFLAIKRGDTKRLTSHYGLKAQSESTGTTLGYYIPEQVLQDMMPGLNLTSMLGSLVTRIPVTQPSGYMPIPNYTLVPTANAGNTAEAQGIESQGRSEGGPYTEETIYVERVNYLVTDNTSGKVKASRELREDFPALEALLRNAIQRDVMSKEEFYILRGNGVGQPLGVLNWTGTVGVAEDTANTFAFADSLEMVSRLHAVNENRVAWVHHPSIVTSIGVIEVGTGGAVLVSNPQEKIPNRFLGYGRLGSQHLPVVDNNGYIILGDWSFYYLFERGGLYIEFSAHADFDNGNDTWRFGKRFDGKPLMTDKVTTSNGSFTVSPFVAINDTA